MREYRTWESCELIHPNSIFQIDIFSGTSYNQKACIQRTIILQFNNLVQNSSLTILLGMNQSFGLVFQVHFGPFPPKSWPKLEKWSQIKHRSKWLKIVTSSYILVHFCQKVKLDCHIWTISVRSLTKNAISSKVQPDHLKSFWAMFDIASLLTIFDLSKIDKRAVWKG